MSRMITAGKKYTARQRMADRERTKLTAGWGRMENDCSEDLEGAGPLVGLLSSEGAPLDQGLFEEADEEDEEDEEDDAEECIWGDPSTS